MSFGWTIPTEMDASCNQAWCHHHRHVKFCGIIAVVDILDNLTVIGDINGVWVVGECASPQLTLRVVAEVNVVVGVIVGDDGACDNKKRGDSGNDDNSDDDSGDDCCDNQGKYFASFIKLIFKGICPTLAIKVDVAIRALFGVRVLKPLIDLDLTLLVHGSVIAQILCTIFLLLKVSVIVSADVLLKLFVALRAIIAL
jgi:hypothetical protein